MSFEPHIRGLYDTYGELTAPLVVESARPSDAPLHPFFEWDDARAAEAHRLEQARSMIRRVRFVVEDEEDGIPERALREFQHVVDTSGGEPRRVYRRVTDFSPEERDEVRERMQREIAALVARYREFDSFWVAIRKLAA